MSQYLAEIVNGIPGIEGLRYLELGVAGGHTFNQVKARDKVGVDIDGQPPVTRASTDEFFANLPARDVFDVVFIDADHEYRQALRDYNHACEHLAERPRRGSPDRRGLIFLHDLYPPDETYTAPHLCGDSYRLLAALWLCGISLDVLDEDYGLTVVYDAPVIDPPARWGRLAYETFRKLPIRRVPLAEFKTRVGEWYA